MATTEILLMLGAIFLVGVAAEVIGRHTPLPRVTLVILAGLLFGPSILGLVDPFGTTWFEAISQVALTMVGFLLGGQLTVEALRRRGKDVLLLSAWVVGLTVVAVAVATWLVSGDLALALLLGAMAIATAPAATVDVARESGAEGDFTDTLLGLVAVDDAWGIAIFSVLAAAAASIAGADPVGALRHGAWELVGGVLLGTFLGIPLAFATGRVRPGDPTLAEALGIVFLCLGAARWLEVSFLMAAVVLGMVVANLAKHHDRPFHAIEHIEWPFMIVFFLLAGAALHVEALAAVGMVGAAYVLARVAGRLAGGYFGAKVHGMSKSIGWWIGPSLLPQAGVSIGLALVAAQRFPGLADVLLPVILASTVLFEVAGPIVTRQALARTGEAG